MDERTPAPRTAPQQYPRCTGNDNPIALARLRAGMTQKEFGEYLGIPHRTIQKWECGARKCPDYVERMILDKMEQTDYKSILMDVLELLPAELAVQIKQRLELE